MKKGAISLISALGGAALGAAGVNEAISKQINDRQKMSDKHFEIYQWFINCLNGLSSQIVKCCSQ